MHHNWQVIKYLYYIIKKYIKKYEKKFNVKYILSMKIDCHSHDTGSDGYNETKDFAAQAISLWLDMCAITNHDRIDRKLKTLLEGSDVVVPEATEITSINSSTWDEIHLTTYSNKFKNEVNMFLDSKIEANIENVKRLSLHFAKMWFYITFEDVLEYYVSRGYSVYSLNISSLARYIYNGKYSVKNKAIVAEIFWEEYDMYWFFTNLIDNEWVDTYEKHKCMLIDVRPTVESVWKVLQKSNAVISIAHPNFSFWDNIDAFEREISYYVDRWINAVEVNSKSSKQWLTSILKMKNKIGFMLTFGSDCHKIWESTKTHGDFWDMNPFLSDELIKENYYSFRKHIWL